MNWFSGQAARVVLLPLLLIAATVRCLGSYTETSDDQTLAWLFSGVLAVKPITSVPLYMHGYGHLLAAFYADGAAVCWLGVLLGVLLAMATGLVFAVLDRLLRPHLRPALLVLVLTLFFGLAWLEHWLWFSHARVALLLAGAGVLFAAQRPGRGGALALGLLVLGAAWLVRPGLAVLGAVAVVPAALLLAGGWRQAAPVLGSAALGLLLATGLLHWQQTPAEAAARRRDAALTRILDYGQLQPRPRTPADSLGTAAVDLWLLGDSTVVNEGLLQRAYQFDAGHFFGREMPAKLALRAGQMLRDYFPLWLALAASVVAVQRRSRNRWFWLVQGGFVGGLLLLAGLFKLPPRVALPLLDFWLLTNAVFWLKPLQTATPNDPPTQTSRHLKPLMQPWARGLGVAALLLVVFLYAAKTGHRQKVLQGEKARNSMTISLFQHRSRLGRPVRVLAGTNDWLKSLSPFRTYSLGPGPVLQLTGWPASDASQTQLRQALTGAADQTECLRRLAQRPCKGPQPQVQWLLTPEAAQWLNRRFRLANAGVQLAQDAAMLPYTPRGMVRYYCIVPQPKQ
ncbi:hypothetical protein [Hymenobacter properus]|uniref:Uncharacterized protein n=1 Tax=Hymenobacter properus TaxID=2791026 RepID=A0A931BCL3_9BACT|nr:hypothetical protein [Hymenobacter properus]MBF9140136.1 hypothetical protein [Hymenobacter properus]MBR7718943.1 hypothetical protein [Microvirga sp. SRT04]